MMKSLFFSLLLLGIATDVPCDTLKAAQIDRLYAEADFVGYVQILSGEFKEYTGAVYKARILTALKGTTAGETEVYFGPFTGYGVGSEYLLFAQKTGTAVEAHWSKTDRSAVPPSLSSTAQYLAICSRAMA